jgi:hypothetical protein
MGRYGDLEQQHERARVDIGRYREIQGDAQRYREIPRAAA